MKNPYDDFVKDAANYVPLSVLSFLPRAAAIYPHSEAIIHGGRRYSWHEVFLRCRRLASGLASLGIGRGDTVSILAPNIPEMVEAHFAVPASGAVLNAINTRLDAETMAYILEHGGCKLLLVDQEFAAVARTALGLMPKNLAEKIIVVDIMDSEYAGAKNPIGALDYAALLAKGREDADWHLPDDEWDAITLNYTSGTTNRPKGVVYHHRGTYLMTTGTISDWMLQRQPRYLALVPLFHCNGWGHSWTVAALGGVIICTRAINAKVIFDAIADHAITHFGGAPIVLSMIVNAEAAVRREIPRGIQVMTAGAPPPPSIIREMEALGFDVLHVYGLTETYGHVTFNAWQKTWDKEAGDKEAGDKEAGADRDLLLARQGVAMTMMEAQDVVDSATMRPVPSDGETIGEIVFRGNTIMKGYFKNPEATAEAFAGGYFHSGDLAVKHADGYVQIKDRLKDIIISGGENISSVEVEATLHKHPAVALAAVVALADEKWGEVPCAFIELKHGKNASAEELIEFCRDNMAAFKRPKKVVFTTIPKTATGKMQKFELRRRLNAGEF